MHVLLQKPHSTDQQLTLLYILVERVLIFQKTYLHCARTACSLATEFDTQIITPAPAKQQHIIKTNITQQTLHFL
jgi:hypothetical protein